METHFSIAIPTSVFLPEKFHGQRNLVGYSPWDPKDSDMTEHASKGDTSSCHTWGGVAHMVSQKPGVLPNIHPTLHKTTSTSKDNLAPNGNISEVKNYCFSVYTLTMNYLKRK